jgi:hypothetical protein
MHDTWTDPATLTSFVIAVTGLVAAIGGVIVGYKAHSKIKNDIKPELEAVKQEVNGGSAHP